MLGWGIFLAVWSFFVIGNIDNVIRPMLISRGANIPFLWSCWRMEAGVGGIVGLFVGPRCLPYLHHAERMGSEPMSLRSLPPRDR
jgi:predicted PurR-regulated permease PerM